MRFSAFTRHALSAGVLCLLGISTAAVQAQGLRAAGVNTPARASGISRALEQTQSPALSRESGLRSADFIVAVVNSEPVTNNEVHARMARVQESLAKQGGARPASAQLAREVLEHLILEKAQVQYAKEVGIKVDEYGSIKASRPWPATMV